MKKSVFRIVLAINIVALAILGYVWWANGREDTWFYVTAAIIVLTSLLSAKPRKKDPSQ